LLEEKDCERVRFGGESGSTNSLCCAGVPVLQAAVSVPVSLRGRREIGISWRGYGGERSGRLERERDLGMLLLSMVLY